MYSKVIHQNKEAGIEQVFHQDDDGNVTLETKQNMDTIKRLNALERQATEGMNYGEGRRIARLGWVQLMELQKIGICDENFKILDQARLWKWLKDSENKQWTTFTGKTV